MLDIAIQAAKSAGSLLLEGFGTTYTVRSKSARNDLVTEFDIASENLIRQIIEQRCPDSSVLGEESGYTEGNGDVLWVVDPLDGTVNFAHQIPIFCVSVAAFVHGSLTCGVIYQPLLDELFTAVLGGGSFLNGKRISVSSTNEFRDSFLVTGFPYNVASNPGSCINQVASLLRRGIPIRRLGSAALDLAYVAAGRFDGFWEVSLNPWDTAAGVLLVCESGGIVTHYECRQYNPLSTDSIVASNGHIHKELVNSILEGADGC